MKVGASTVTRSPRWDDAADAPDRDCQIDHGEDITVTAAAKASPAAKPLSRRRSVGIWALVVVATIIGIASILTIWVNRQVLDNDAWRTSSAEPIADPAVQDTVSAYLVNQLYDNVDVAASLEQRLPPNLKGLAAPLAGALRAPTTRAVDRLLQSPRVQQAWVNANGVAHQKLINVLENKTGNGSRHGKRGGHPRPSRALDRARSGARALHLRRSRSSPRMPEWSPS